MLVKGATGNKRAASPWPNPSLFFLKTIEPVLLFQAGVCGSAASVRWLNLQEYQSKRLMDDHGINVQKFRVADTVEQAKEIAQSFSRSHVFYYSLFLIWKMGLDISHYPVAWWHQAITWANVVLDLCCHMASLGHNGSNMCWLNI